MRVNNMNILLDYVFKVSSFEGTAAASTGFLKKVCAVVKPKGGVTPGTVTLCTSKTAVDALTDNVDCDQLFDAGLSSIYVLPANNLDIADFLVGFETDFFTILISSDFSDAEIQTVGETPAVAANIKIQDILYTAKTAGVAGNDITVIYNDTNTGGAASASLAGSDITVSIEGGVTTAATIAAAIVAAGSVNAIVAVVVDAGDETDPQIEFTPHIHLANGANAIPAIGLDVGEFNGVIGCNSSDDTDSAIYAAIENRVGFYSVSANKAKNMFYAIGKVLANALNWRNQQYITMPFDDEIETLGDADAYFDDKISFVITDSEYGKRLALLACGGKAIVAPYIKRNLEIDMQSTALNYISSNQPQYTKREAALLENALQDVINQYVEDQWIEAGTIEVTLEEDNFVASGQINIVPPTALWRIYAEMQQTL